MLYIYSYSAVRFMLYVSTYWIIYGGKMLQSKCLHLRAVYAPACMELHSIICVHIRTVQYYSNGSRMAMLAIMM